MQALGDEVSHYDGEVTIESCLDIGYVLRQEFAEVDKQLSGAIVVSGKQSMTDEARRIVCSIGKRRKGDITLIGECFGW